MVLEYGHRPEIRVRIWTRSGELFTLEPFSYQSSRGLANPVDQATLTFYGDSFDTPSGARQFEDALHYYDLAEISMLDFSGRRWVDVVGLVVDCQIQEMENQEGDPIKMAVVQVSGIGEALRNYGIWWFDPSDPDRSNLGGLGYRNRTDGANPKGRPDEVLLQIYGTWVNDQYEFRFADGTLLSQALFLEFDQIPDTLNTLGSRIAAEQGDLWSVLYKYSEPPWQELFVYPANDFDSEQIKAVLRLRPTPFDFGAWDKLKATEGWGFDYATEERLPGGEKVGFNQEVYNFFWTTAKGHWSKAKQSKGAHVHANHRLPIIDSEGVRRLGARRLEKGTEFVQFLTRGAYYLGDLSAPQKLDSKTRLRGLYEMLSKRSVQLHRWFGYDDFRQGTITTRGRIGESREHGSQIGSILTRKRDNREFYVTGVMQSWSHPGPWLTTWQVSRGHYVKKYRQWWQESQVTQAIKDFTPDIFGI